MERNKHSFTDFRFKELINASDIGSRECTGKVLLKLPEQQLTYINK